MTASPISDLNPLFMAARCKLLLAASGGIRLEGNTSFMGLSTPLSY